MTYFPFYKSVVRDCCSHYTALHYTTLHYTTLHYTTLHYTTLHHTILHYTTLYYTILYYNNVLQITANSGIIKYLPSRRSRVVYTVVPPNSADLGTNEKAAVLVALLNLSLELFLND